jgi:hypothetical protein
MLTRRNRNGADGKNADAAPRPRRRWVTPTVHTLVDLVPMSALGNQTPTAGRIAREWDLLGFGILMTTDGVLHSLDPTAYRTWQLSRRYDGVDQVARELANEWDVDVELARRDASVVLRRLNDAVAASA